MLPSVVIYFGRMFNSLSYFSNRLLRTLCYSFVERLPNARRALYPQCIQVDLRMQVARPGAIPNPESESKDESESGFDSGSGIICSGIGFGVGIV